MNLPRNLSKRSLLIVSSVGLALTMALIVQFIFRAPTHGDPVSSAANATLPKHKQERSPLPVRLKIPKINVDASLEYVGLTRGGDVGAPKVLTNAAWFNRWPRPGEKGNAVIVGHYSGVAGVPAVFNDLYKLHKGDKLYIEDKKGKTTSFIVTGRREYDPEAVATAVFRSHDGAAHLNLITCDGAWNEAANTYSKRLAVFADKAKN